MKHYVFLLMAIAFEIVATSSLKMSEQFTKLIPSVVTVVCYIAAFYFLSLTLRTLPVGIAYALWSAIGIVFITIIGIFAFKQVPDLPAIIGLVLIVAGVVIINVWSKTSAH
ncbi:MULTISPECIES: DMT family transporter [unclassified Dysgonomonas]|uniref:DMT family transporter n=1 Tax=unclassified Dysgonomonas TaxID=2630389 RepID=UPI000680F3AB|nr:MULTISPECIES: multidrug efflux SMR transporter [unclassified Dysgonomonas]MBD8347355.1 multidrug efflux SMR transporter [Dysgonomonas sp. HGC4]MBF0576819.1 multidrug efflux SMR transporter [Dysgonomonas sp. GY617]